MPRQARVDSPGTLHHVIVRGINKRRIVDGGESGNLPMNGFWGTASS